MEIDALKAISFEMTVLIVEDEIEVQKYLAKFLSRLFKEVAVASDGKEALELYKKQKYDLIITDIRMPNMDGLALISEIRQIDKMQNIVVSSAHNESQILIELLNDGINGFILKPILMANVVTNLLRVCTAIHEKKLLIHYVGELERLESELAAMQTYPI